MVSFLTRHASDSLGLAILNAFKVHQFNGNEASCHLPALMTSMEAERDRICGDVGAPQETSETEQESETDSEAAASDRVVEGTARPVRPETSAQAPRRGQKRKLKVTAGDVVVEITEEPGSTCISVEF